LAIGIAGVSDFFAVRQGAVTLMGGPAQIKATRGIAEAGLGRRTPAGRAG
jgi:hypothetical protein